MSEPDWPSEWGWPGVGVAAGTGVFVGVGVGLAVGIGEGVSVGAEGAMGVSVAVGTCVGVGVAVGAEAAVGVGVASGVWLGVAAVSVFGSDRDSSSPTQATSRNSASKIAILVKENCSLAFQMAVGNKCVDTSVQSLTGYWAFLSQLNRTSGPTVLQPDLLRNSQTANPQGLFIFSN